MLPTVNGTFGAAWCCWWLCSLVGGKLRNVSFVKIVFRKYRAS